jgi:DNA polymerase
MSLWRVPVMAHDDFDGWRDTARRLIQAGVAPDRVGWSLPGEAAGDLFANDRPPLPPADAPPVRASRGYLELARSAALHADPRRFDVLYRVLWRLQSAPRLMEDRADPDVRAIDALARVVRRDIHKMRAFVRLHKGPPANRTDAPGGDPAEALWRTYYAAIFNPARLKIDAMVKEMPRRYWKNLPEADLIPDLIAQAQAREAAMIALGGEDMGRAPETLAALDAAVAACRRCAIGCNGTRAVPGEGVSPAPLMIVGEQPGDTEERVGRPFVGPAGQVLRDHAAKVGLDLAAARLTNAVRHFRHVPRGKQRLHQTPLAREIDTCRWWLDAERALVRPRLIVALGASAARGIVGRTVGVQQERGRFIPLDHGAHLLITTHPSYLLRLGEGARAEEDMRFSADLALAVRHLAGG